MLSSSRPRARPNGGRHAPGLASDPCCSARAGDPPAKPPYWVLELLVERLGQQVAELEQALEVATCPQPPGVGADRLDEIRTVVCERLGVSPAALESRARGTRVAWARQVAMYLARELTDATLPTIGAAFGRNHTTVLHACRRVSERVATDIDAQEVVRTLTLALQQDGAGSTLAPQEPRVGGDRRRLMRALRIPTPRLMPRASRRLVRDA